MSESSREERNLQNLLAVIKELVYDYHRSSVASVKQQLKDSLNEYFPLLEAATSKCLKQGKIEFALHAYQFLLEELEKIGLDDFHLKSRILNQIGFIYSVWGDHRKALHYVEHSLTLFRKAGDRVGEAGALNNLGKIHQALGNFQQALDFLKQSLSLIQSLKDRQLAEEGRILDNIGQIYFSMGSYPHAQDYFQQALLLAREVNDKVGEGTSLHNLGLVSYELGNFSDLLDKCTKALEIRRKFGNKVDEVNILNNIGLGYTALKETQQALDYYHQSLSIAEEIGYKEGQARALSNISGVYSTLEDFNQTLAFLFRALPIVQELGNPSAEVRILHKIGDTYNALQNFSEAFLTLRKAIEISELLVGEIQSELIRQEFRGSLVHVHYTAVMALVGQLLLQGQTISDPAKVVFEILKYLELTKARELTDKLEQATDQTDLSIICPEYRELILEEQRLTEQINDFYRIYYQESLLSQSSSQNSLEKSTTLPRSITKSQLDQLAIKIKDLRRKILENCSDPGLIRQTTDFNSILYYNSIFDYQPNIVIWEFFFEERLFDNFFFVIVWDNKTIYLHRSNKIDLAAVFRLLSRFQKAIDRGDFSKSEDLLQQLSILLGESLTDQIWQSLVGKDLLVLIPHEKLHLLPWHIAKKPSRLITDQAASTNAQDHLGLLIPIVRSYSLSLVLSCIKRDKKMADKFLFVSNPNFNIDSINLPGADLEVNSIIDFLSTLPSPVEITALHHQKASKEVFMDAILETPSIIHFAGHGKFDTTDPWQSNLQLFSAKGFDRLTVTELVQKRFSGTPLFILSACETARGEISRGDEAVGLIRGLTLSGATSIIATNWLLLDHVAPYFMKKFYQHYLQGESVAHALFHARKELYELGYSNPIDWAVYDLYGNPFKRINSEEQF